MRPARLMAAALLLACLGTASCGGKSPTGAGKGDPPAPAPTPTPTPAYSMADLKGTWESHDLASGPGAPWWARGRLTIAADGSQAGTLTDSDGGTELTSGTTLSISSGGVVTTGGSSTRRGVLDAGKTVAVGTDTWSTGSPGTTELSVALKVGAYALSDLAGAWEFNALASGPGEPWWERARITIAADGHFEGATVNSEGVQAPVSGVFGLSPLGVVEQLGSSTFRGALDAGKTVLVGTDTWSTGSPGTTELKVAVRLGSTYALSDLAGTWEVSALASGMGAPWWDRGRITIAADGSFSGSSTDSDGGTTVLHGAFRISPSGAVTLTGSSTFRGVLDAGKTVLVGTDTWSTGSPGTTELKIAVKMN